MSDGTIGPSRRALLRGIAGATMVPSLSGVIGASGQSEAAEREAEPEYEGWFSDVENYRGETRDWRGSDEVTVRVGDLADGFYVADDGPGVPSDEREAVFDPGYTSTDRGAGLGLPIVARIAEAHGWTVTLGDSEAGGARVEVSF